MFRRLLHTKSFYLLSFLLICCITTTNGQGFSLSGDTKRITLPFKFIRNLVIIDLKINNAGPYNFILDTGAGFMIITEPTLVDSINIQSKRIVKVSGLGNGESYEAYVTPVLKIDIPGMVSNNVSAAIFKKDHFGLSQYAGMPIHGLLGYEFFSQLAVKVNFTDTTLTIARSNDMRKFKKGISVPISIEENKPYLQAKITRIDGTEQAKKLLVDLGAGHPLSLENVVDGYTLSDKYIDANLGVGLNGVITGQMGRVKNLEIGKYNIKNVLSAFPQLTTMVQLVNRDGNLGTDIIKKFTVVFDYPNSVLYLKPNAERNVPFEHDMSGLQYFGAGKNYKNVVIERVEPGSAGEEAGLCANDEIVSINFKPVVDMSLEQIDQLFKSKNNRSLLLKIYRNNERMQVILTLRRRI